MRALVKLAAVAIGFVLGSGTVLAHHGASVVYDMSQSVTMTGLVTDFQFVNPHVLIYFEVEEIDGNTTIWSAGLTSPNRLARNDGWSSDTFEPGDAVTIIGSPARTGAPSLWVEQVLDGNGNPLLGED